MLPTLEKSPDQAGSDGGRTLVIGLGNPLLTDDSVGLRVAARLRKQLAGRADVEVAEDYWGGLRLMERLVGYRRAIIIDATYTGGVPGTIGESGIHDLPTRHSQSVHDVDLPTALALGRQAGAVLPDNHDIRLVTIEAADVLTFAERCTPLVEASVARAVEAVLRLLPSGR